MPLDLSADAAEPCHQVLFARRRQSAHPICGDLSSSLQGLMSELMWLSCAFTHSTRNGHIGRQSEIEAGVEIGEYPANGRRGSGWVRGGGRGGEEGEFVDDRKD